LNKLQVRINEATKFFDKYEYSRVRQIAEEFFWKDFCDNYLEIVKKRIYGEEGKGKKSAQYTLHKSLLDIIKMIAPLMPFVSEEIYQTHFKKDGDAKSIHLSDWPKEGEVNNFEELESFYEVLGRIRGEKSNAKKSMRSEIKVSLDKETHKKLEGMIDDLSNVTNATNISEGEFGVEFV